MDQKKLRRILCAALPAAAAALACLVCFFVVWFYYLRGAETKTRSTLLNDSYDTLTAALQQDAVLSEDFTTDTPLYGVGFVFRRLDDAVDGALLVRMTDVDTGETVLDVTGRIGQVSHDGYTAFALQKTVNKAGTHHWHLEITAQYTAAAGQLALAKSTTVPAGFGNLQENGTPAQGALAVQTAVEQLGGVPLRGYWLLCAACAALSAVLVLLCRAHRPGKALLTALTVLAMGLCYQFVLPVYAAPDEVIHYHTAYALSNAWLGIQPQQEGMNFVLRACDAPDTWTNYRTDAFTYREVLTHLADRAAADEPLTEMDAELLGGYPAPYLLSAAGITLARALHFGGVGTAMFGRLWNLMFFAAMAGLAVWLAPRAKGLFAAAALLPMSLHLGGSYSYDSFLLALTFVLTALCLRLMLQEKTASWTQLAAMCVLCALIAPLKAIYLPLCLVVFLIPAQRFASKRACIGARAAVIGSALAAFAAYSLRTVLAVLVRQAAQPAVQAAGQSAAVSNYSLFALLRTPGVLLKLLCATFLPNADRYAASILGGSLGYLNLSEIHISGILLLGFCFALVWGSLPQADQEEMRPWQRWLTAAIAVLVFGLLTAACVQWTPSDYTYIWGFQGRYLLPLAPLVLLALPKGGLHLTGDRFAPVLGASWALEVFVLLNVLSVIYQR